MAVYNLSSLNLNKCKALKVRNLYLFPDLSKDGKAFDLCSNKAAEIQKSLPGTYFHVSELLEKLASQQDKEQGKDIADYLIKQEWRLFRRQDIEKIPQLEPIKNLTHEKHAHKKETFFLQPDHLSEVAPSQSKQIQSWDTEIAELENYFAGINLPIQPVKLNRCSTIKDCSLFIESHFTTVKANNGKRAFLPYLKRLRELKIFL